jgi:hypothetical protein
MGSVVEMRSKPSEAERDEPYKAGDEVFWGDSFDLDKVGVVLEAFRVGATPSKSKYPELQGQIQPFGAYGYVVAVTRGDKKRPTRELSWLPDGLLRLWSMTWLAFDIALDNCMTIIDSNSVRVTRNGVTSFDMSGVKEHDPAFADVNRALFFLTQTDEPFLVRDKTNPSLFTCRNEMAEA